MTIYTIQNESNHIIRHVSQQDADVLTGAERFSSEADLATALRSAAMRNCLARSAESAIVFQCGSRDAMKLFAHELFGHPDAIHEPRHATSTNSAEQPRP